MKKIIFLTVVMVLSLAFGVTTNAQTKKIGMEKARRIAMQKAEGKIESAELERENGKTIYSFDIRNSKGTITEVQVEAFTGEIVSVQEENAQQEAAEKRQDKQASDKQDDDEESDASQKANQAKYAREAKITMAQAKEIALKRVPGTITDQELEKEKGKLLYSFDVKDANGKSFYVEIDAKTGAILKVEEDKEDEADDDN
jgi:uncharacterized membrane protein YkoI